MTIPAPTRVPSRIDQRIRITTDEGDLRFLGLPVAERNRRVVARARGCHAGELMIPAGVAITRTLVESLPPAGAWELFWDISRPPIVWSANANGAGQTGPPPHISRTLDGAALDVSTASARRAATWQLLRESGKPTDGWLSRHVHRKISRVLSFVLLQLRLSANVATLLTLLVGIASAWLIAQTSHLTMILGALLFWFASIADGIDGEMARVTLTESPRGEQIDTAVDHLTHVLCYAGVLVGWWRQGIDAAGYALAIVVSIGVAATLLWAMRIVRRAKHLQGQLFVDTKPIELGIVAAAERTAAPILRAAAWVFALFRREAFSLSFLVIAFVTSRRAVYPFTIAVGLAIVALTLIVHGRTIEQAIQKA